MKRFSLFLAAAFALLASCTQEFRTETFEFDRQIPFHEGSDFYDGLSYTVEYPVAGFSKAALKQMRSEIFKACLGEAYANFDGTLEEMAADIAKVHTEEYVTANQNLLKELEIEEDEANNLNWESMVSGSFGEEYDKYINYQYSIYEYYGGAHGMNYDGALVLDKKTGKAVTYDTFTKGVSREGLMELLDEYKMDNLVKEIEYDLKPEDVFYAETIEPSDKFRVGEEGITFYYDPYDLAPYVFGGIEITIPWEALEKKK